MNEKRRCEYCDRIVFVEEYEKHLDDEHRKGNWQLFWR